MSYRKGSKLAAVLLISFLIASNWDCVSLARPLEDDGVNGWMKDAILVMQALDKGSVPPSGHSNCSTDGSNTGGVCPPNTGG